MAKANPEAQSALAHDFQTLKQLPADTVDAVKESAIGVRAGASELVASAGEQARDVGFTIAEEIRANPFRSMCVAVCMGYVIGRVIARR